MTNSNGVDPIHLRQLRAIAENLCLLAKRHRENHNYVVAYALYGRASAIAQEIHTPEKDGNVLASRIRADQQAVFEMLRSGEGGLENSSLKKT
jgi:predicted neuraminidase